MDTRQKSLVLNLTLGRLSKEKFLDKFPEYSSAKESYIAHELACASSTKDGGAVECLLLIGFNFNFPENCAEVLCKLILQDWHTSHENIASILQRLKNPQTVDCLYQASFLRLPYLEFDEHYAFGVKCIYALWEIGTTDALEKLVSISRLNNPVLAKKASYLLQVRR